MSQLEHVLFDSYAKEGMITKNDLKSIIIVLDQPISNLKYVTQDRYNYQEYLSVLTNLFIKSEKNIPDRLKIFDTSNDNTLEETIGNILEDLSTDST